MGISKIFWVLERDKGDMTSKHAHILLECSEEISHQQATAILNNSIVSYEEVQSKSGASNYVTKFISHPNIEYDLVFAKS